MKLFKRKHYFTLLETLIAVSLVSILLTVVFGFFRELSVVSRQTELKQQESFKMRYVQTRLSFIFERIVNDNDEYKREFYFFTQEPDKDISEHTSLIFSFNNEMKANPAFSGDLLARLYVDSQHRLCLAMWPMYSEHVHQDMQKEILVENVADIKYEFYMPPERISNAQAISTNKVDSEKNEPEKDLWHPQEWFNSYKQMPAIVRLKLKIAKNKENLESKIPRSRIEKTEDLTFDFVLPSSKNFLYYPPD